MQLSQTQYRDLTLWHEPPKLGDRVPESIYNLVHLYATRLSLLSIPPINLIGTAWTKSWDSISTIEGCTGNSGPSNEELRMTGVDYAVLEISIPNAPLDCASPYPDPGTIEGTIAHEMCHLKWRSLPHGPEFFARVLALLRGAKFPTKGRFNKGTTQILTQTRIEANHWYEALLGINVGKSAKP